MTPQSHYNSLPETYIVTGLDTSGRRFRLRTTSRAWAFGINLWRGSVWKVVECFPRERRKLVKRVFN